LGLELEEAESEEAQRAAIAHRLREDVVGVRVGVVVAVTIMARARYRPHLGRGIAPHSFELLKN